MEWNRRYNFRPLRLHPATNSRTLDVVDPTNAPRPTHTHSSSPTSRMDSRIFDFVDILTNSRTLDLVDIHINSRTFDFADFVDGLMYSRRRRHPDQLMNS